MKIKFLIALFMVCTILLLLNCEKTTQDELTEDIVANDTVANDTVINDTVINDTVVNDTATKDTTSNDSVTVDIVVPTTIAADMSVYFIGNSLTASLTLDRLHRLFEQRGADLQFGSHLSGAKTLQDHFNYKQYMADNPNANWGWWETNIPQDDTFEPASDSYKSMHNPDNSDREPKYGGFYDKAMANYIWNAIVLQPYAASLNDDIDAATQFINFSTCDTFYIYTSWPALQSDYLDYAERWDREYTDPNSNNNNASRSYYDQLISKLKEDHPTKQIKIIPAGEVLYEIDKMIKEGTLPGIKELAERDRELLPGLDRYDTSVEEDLALGVYGTLYADDVHLNPSPHKVGTLGIFISGSTMFSALSGTNPAGMSAADYGLDDVNDAALIKAVQETIWGVVSKTINGTD